MPIQRAILILPEGVERKPNRYPVTSCLQAAQMKGIPLGNELKSLVLCTSDGLSLCHIRGDTQLALRKVKNALTVREAHLASTLELAELGVEPGTVSPFLDTLRTLPSIIDPSLMDLDFISTNDGTRYGSIYFAPVQLTLLPGDHLLYTCSQSSPPP